MIKVPHPAVDALQREVLESMYVRCPADAREALGLNLERIADVSVSIAEHDPSILLNRGLGLGSETKIEKATIDAVVACYRRHGVERFFLHVYPSTLPAGGAAWLAEAGLEKARGWMQFARGDGPAPEAPTDLTVKRVDARHRSEFARIVSSAFGLREVSRPYMAALLADDRWRVFMSFDGDVAAGAGALFIAGSFAYLGFGATVPAYRRRGSQSAVMAARIGAALEAGCTTLLTETGEAVEDEDQISYRNIMRVGFEPIGLCENWAPRKVTR